jgi:hypothetical protein
MPGPGYWLSVIGGARGHSIRRELKRYNACVHERAMRHILVAAGLIVLATGLPAARGGRAQGLPADPYQIRTVCTPAVSNAGRRVSAASGDELQRALDNAAAGDIILLQPGATYRPAAPEGSFVLRNRAIPAGQWVVIRSAHSAFDPRGSLQSGTRVGEANAAMMPQLRAIRGNVPAIKAERGAHGYRLIGLDIGADASVQQLANLVELGTGLEDSLDQLPSEIVIDRCYLHGSDVGSYRRGIAMNGMNLAVIDSHLSNFHDAGSDSQAIGGWNGGGPFKIVNNYLEAASENIMFGGSDPAIPNLVPSDIEIRRNLSTKRLEWRDARVPVKNAFELKNARRVLVEGNVFERVWPSGQDGTAILLKSVNQDGNCPWCVTEYVTFRRNIVRNAAHGLAINAVETGRRGLAAPVHANHIRIEDVLFEELTGKLFRIFGGVSDVSITHVTSRSNPAGVLDPRDPADANPNLVFKFNIVERMAYGIGAGGDEGAKTLSRNFSPYVYRQNVLVNTSAGGDQSISDGALESRYPATTWVVRGWNDIGFQAGTSKLAKSSRFAAAAEDGHDIGADVDAIAAAQSGIGRSGDGCGPMAVPRPRSGSR